MVHAGPGGACWSTEDECCTGAPARTPLDADWLAGKLTNADDRDFIPRVLSILQEDYFIKSVEQLIPSVDSDLKAMLYI